MSQQPQQGKSWQQQPPQGPLLGSPTKSGKQQGQTRVQRELTPLSTSSYPSDISLAPSMSGPSTGGPRVRLDEKNPLLAPFATGHARTPSQSTSNLYNSVFHRVANTDVAASRSTLSLGSITSPVGTATSPVKERNRNQSGFFSIPSLKVAPSSSSSSPAPQNAKRNDGLTVPSSSNPEKPKSSSTSSQSVTNDRNIEESVNNLKSNLMYDVVVRLNATEADLKNKLESLERTLNDLQLLREKSLKLVTKFENSTQTSNDEMSTQIKELEDAQIGLDVVQSLEIRITKAKTKVEECRQRLTHVNQQVIIQENDHKQRRQRILYAKRGSLGVLLVILAIAVLLYRSSFLSEKHDFDDIMDCLSDLQHCDL